MPGSMILREVVAAKRRGSEKAKGKTTAKPPSRGKGHECKLADGRGR